MEYSMTDGELLEAGKDPDPFAYLNLMEMLERHNRMISASTIKHYTNWLATVVSHEVFTQITDAMKKAK